jgi:tRNA/tmRNA/rRNA uracil-C5-methylase (TrmA/RlmC/RlmD family)
VLTGGNGDPPTVEVADPATPQHLRHVSGARRRTEAAAGRTWQVTGSGFWQVHPGAAQALVDAVRRALRPQPEDTMLDLYGGVGLFAGAVAPPVHGECPGGPAAGASAARGQRTLVEADARAVRDAGHNLRRTGVSVQRSRVERWLRSPDAPSRVDLVVLDPPRSGAKRAVCEAIVRLRPRRVAYVACDPAALARDLRTFTELGYDCERLEAFDIFPMTHHVECVVSLRPGDGRGRMVAPGGTTV